VRRYVCAILLACVLAATLSAALCKGPICASGARERDARLTKSQVRLASRGIPATAARWAPTINKYWTRWHYRLLGHGLTVSELRYALLICLRESRGLPNARNPYSGCSGLFQLLPAFSRGRYNLYNPVTNISLAGMLFARRGFSPWQI
jgi:hypothetical protein